MKHIILVILTLTVSQEIFCQMGIGADIGYSSKKSGIGEGYIQFKAKSLLITPLAMKIHAAVSDPTLPVIFESRIGTKINFIEPFVGYGYHLAGSDNRKEYDQYKGFRPACGIIFHYKKLILTTELSGKVLSFGVGVFNWDRYKKKDKKIIMSDDIPVTFTYQGKEYKGHFSKVAGAGSSAVFYLYVDSFYWGRLCFSAFKNAWVFDPTPKTEGLEDLVNEFADLIIAWYE